jgi:hypothetical protein
MARSKQTPVVALVPPADVPRDLLAVKTDELAMHIAEMLKSSGEIAEKIDGLKALSAYLAASRGKGAASPPAENAFARYREAQGAT